MNIKKGLLSDFAVGLIIGFVVGVIIMSPVLVLVINRYKNKEIKEYAEMQTELQVLQEDYFNRPADEFLDDSDVRAAVDGAVGEFERRRDELLRAVRQRTAK